MDIVERLRHTEEETATIGKELVYLQVPVNPDGPEAADEIEKLREENQKQREKIMLLNSMIQTEHEIIRVAALKEGE